MIKRLMSRYVLMAEEGGSSGGGAGGDATTASTDAAAAPAATTAQDSAPSFADSLGDDALKAYATAKGYKTSAEAVKALQDSEAVFAKPETADAYELPVPEGQPKDFAKEASNWFHEAGVPKAMAQQLAGKWNEYAASQAQAAELAQQQEGERQMGELKKEWGGQYDANIERGRSALTQFGVSKEVVAQMEKTVGAAQIIKTFSAIGAAISEGVLSGGGNSGGSAAPADPEKARAYRMFASSSKQS